MSEPEETMVGGGAIPAVVARATIVPPPVDACTAPQLQVTTAAFTLDDGPAALFLVEADQQVPDALDAATITTMIQSLRPASRGAVGGTTSAVVASTSVRRGQRRRIER
jgi:hypothetical protein